MKRYLIRTNCTYKGCRAWKQCSKIAAEVHESDGKVDTLFLGEGAGRVEAEKCYPFAGSSGFALRSIINDVNEKNRGFAFDNLVRFWPKDEEGETRAPTKKEIHQCLPHLLNNIERIKPKKVCFIGNSSFKFFTKISRGITAERGILRRVKIGEQKYDSLGTFHTAMALWAGQPDLLGVIGWDVDRILNRRIIEINKDDLDVERLFKIEKVEKLFKYLWKEGEFKYLSIDLETDNLNILFDNRPLSIGLSTGKRTWAIPLYHPQTPFAPDEIHWILKQIRKLAIQAEHFKWIGHHTKFERLILKNFSNIPYFQSPFLDTLPFAFVLDEGRLAIPAESLSLKYLARNEFQYKGYSDKDVLEARNQGRMAEVPIKPHCDYVGEDAFVTRHMFDGLRQMARWQDYERQALNLLEHFYDPLYFLFAQMETDGIYIDKNKLRDLKSSKRSIILRRLVEIEERFQESKSGIKTNKRLVKERSEGMQPLFGDPWAFNINTVYHKQKLFFETLKLQPINFGKEGPSLDKEFQKVYRDVKEVAWYSEYQALKQLKNLYVDQIWDFLSPGGRPDCQDGRVRPSFSGTGTKTGRGKAKNPNSQQIVRAEKDKPERTEIRSLFRAAPGRVLLYADVMTAEVRVWGQEAKDEVLCGIFKKGQRLRNKYRKNPTKKLKERAELEGDFHTMTAAESYDIEPRIAKEEYRQGTKSVSLGRMYGRSLASIAEQIGKTEKEVEEIDKRVFSKYKKGLEWFHKMEKMAEEFGFVESQMGRRRRLYAFLTDNSKMQADAKRRARNSPIQGFSSDLVFLGASLIAKFIMLKKLSWKIGNAVHDSIMIELPIEELMKAIKLVEKIFLKVLPKYMKKYFGIKMIVPIEVEFEFGTSLGNLVKWDFSKPHFKVIKKKLEKIVEQDLQDFKMAA